MPKREYIKMKYREPVGLNTFPNLNTTKPSDIAFVAAQKDKGPKPGSGNYDEHLKFYVTEYPVLKRYIENVMDIQILVWNIHKTDLDEELLPLTTPDERRRWVEGFFFDHVIYGRVRGTDTLKP